MAVFGGVPTQLGRAVKGPAKGPAPWHGGSGTMLGRNIPAPGQAGGSFTQTSVGRPQTAPPATTPAPAASLPSSPASPLDSTYYNNIAANQFKVNNQINSLTAQGQNYNTGLQSALAQLAYQQPRDQLKAEQAMNARGGLYSSVEGQNQGNIVNQYQTRQSGLTQANAQRQAAIGSQISGLQAGEPLYEAGQYDDAVARAVKAALANPATGQAPISTPPPAAPAASILGSPVPKGVVKKNGALNVNVPKVKSGFGYRGGI